ncbi:efflux RND transporter periplasmic adaptor subunit [Endozoicomonas sp.]|uniref:efflux RND transporter periplasmic adaptor subunit n=1 Tax=Endozoicomonas sp. TaxID=1892382 RepID=UPI0028840DA7|nr:efflux RND transporter periplasmic adaptor subunit [Endozoicomonas sp.]
MLYKNISFKAMALGVVLVANSGTVLAASTDVPAMVVKAENIYYENTYIGRVKAVDHLKLSPKVSGEIVSIHFTEGRVVNAGDVMFTIDPEPYELMLDSSLAALQASEAQYTNTLSTLERSEKLMDSQAISEQQLLDHRANARIHKANVAKAKAAVKQAELNLRYTRITAPITGQTGERKVSVGDIVASGSTVLTDIVATDPVNITFNVTDLDLLSGVAERSDLQLMLSHGEQYPHIGQVDFVNNTVSSSSSNIMVRATFPNPDNTLVSGLFTRIKAIDSQPVERIVVPQRSVMENQSGRYVYVNDKNNTVAIRPVTTGARIGENWVIETGLEENDIVLTRNLQLLRPGQTVNIQLAEGV